MQILIIGGTGFISSYITRLLLENGHIVTVFTRGRSKNNVSPHPNLNFIFGDRHNLKDLAAAALLKITMRFYDLIAYEPGE